MSCIRLRWNRRFRFKHHLPPVVFFSYSLPLSPSRPLSLFAFLSSHRIDFPAYERTARTNWSPTGRSNEKIIIIISWWNLYFVVHCRLDGSNGTLRCATSEHGACVHNDDSAFFFSFNFYSIISAQISLPSLWYDHYCDSNSMLRNGSRCCVCVCDAIDSLTHFNWRIKLRAFVSRMADGKMTFSVCGRKQRQQLKRWYAWVFGARCGRISQLVFVFPQFVANEMA